MDGYIGLDARVNLHARGARAERETTGVARRGGERERPASGMRLPGQSPVARMPGTGRFVPRLGGLPAPLDLSPHLHLGTSRCANASRSRVGNRRSTCMATPSHPPINRRN